MENIIEKIIKPETIPEILPETPIVIFHNINYAIERWV